MKLLKPVDLVGDQVVILDQTKLPEERLLRLNTCVEVAEAIKEMRIRGAGAIGLAAAYAMVLSAVKNEGNIELMSRDASLLKRTRPTAVSLSRSVDKMLITAENREYVIESVKSEAKEMARKFIETEIKIGEHGASLMKDGDVILTHCNAGAMAFAGYGGVTLSTFRKCMEKGKRIKVIATETRPYLQGARITAWELKKFGFDFKIIPDSAVGFCMQRGMIDKVLVGADRIAANGDVVNKVGTYPIAVVANEHDIPVYVAGDVDVETKRGEDIEVEMRGSEEVLEFKGQRIAPEGCDALYPAFDVTPARYINAILTDRGVERSPFDFSHNI